MINRRIAYVGAAVAGWHVRPGGVLASTIIEDSELGAYQTWNHDVLVNPFQINVPREILLCKNGDHRDTVETEVNAFYSIDRPKEGPDGEMIQNWRGLYAGRWNIDAPELAESGFLYCTQVGRRIIISWNEDDTADFGSYNLYWNEGDGDPTTLLASIENRSELRYVTEELVSGTYKFLLLLADIAGNESADTSPSGVLEVTLAVPPDAPEVATTYDQTTRRARFEITGTGDGGTDVIVMFSNWMPGRYGLRQQAQMIYRYPFIPVSGEDWNATTQTLWAGQWDFRIARFSNNVYSDFVNVRLTLVEDGGILYEATEVEAVPELFPEVQAAGVIRVHQYTELTAAQSVELEVSTDGATWTSETSFTDSYYDFSGTDGTTYYFRAYILEQQEISELVTIEAAGPYCDTVYAEADETPPDGDQTLTAEVI